MIPGKRPAEEVRQLMQDYYLREMTAAEMDLLSEVLRADAALRRAFMEVVRDDLIMHRVARRALGRRVNFRIRRPVSVLQRVRQMAATVLLLLAGFAATYVLIASRTPSDAELVATVLPAKVESVARVIDFYTLRSDEIQVENDGRVRALDADGAVYMGDRVRLPKGAHLELRYTADETQVRFESEAVFEVMQTTGAKHLRLESGKMVASVDKQPAAQPMRVWTADAEAVVLGTEFELSARELTRLAVSSGRVQMNTAQGDESVLVDGGFYADHAGGVLQALRPFEEWTYAPVTEATLNCRHPRQSKLIIADPVRNYRGLIEFDLDDLKGEVIEATLRLNVVNFGNDQGGKGCIRAFCMESPDSTDLSSVMPNRSAQVSSYRGRIGAGMQMVLELDPLKIKAGRITLLLMMDEGGNDFGFGSSHTRGTRPPSLEIKTTR